MDTDEERNWAAYVSSIAQDIAADALPPGVQSFVDRGRAKGRTDSEMARLIASMLTGASSGASRPDWPQYEAMFREAPDFLLET